MHLFPLLLIATAAAAQDTAVAACQRLSHRHTTEVTMAYRYFPTAPLDVAWAHSVFDSIAGQWSRPHFRHERTDIVFTLRRDSAVKGYRLHRSSGNKNFDNEATLALARAASGHKLPPLPATYAGDSVVFLIMFGDLASYADSLYAAQDRHPPEPDLGNEEPQWPPGWNVIGGSVPVIAEFEVDTNGRVDASTVRITSAPNEDFAAAVKHVIPGWRFTPALDHCRPVRSTYRYNERYRGP